MILFVNMKKFLSSVFLVIGLFVSIGLFVTPEVTSAQAGGLVQCSGTDCNWCSLMDTINAVINWLIILLIALTTVLFVIAGLRLVTSAGDPSAMQSAKSMLTNTVIGFVIILSSWLVIDTLLTALTGDNRYLSLDVVDCGGMRDAVWLGDPDSLYGGTQAGDPDAGMGGGAAALDACSTSGIEGTVQCQALTAACKNAGSCSVSPDIAANIDRFHQDVAAAGITGTRVTEGMPPTVNHQSACHRVGTCIDYGKQGGMTAAEINTTAQAAHNNGLRPVYEVKTQTEKAQLVANGADPDVIKVIPQITAPHFSVYGY